MATYVTAYVSALEKLGDGSFRVLATAPAQSTVTESEADGVLEEGELVTVETTMNDEILEAPIEGIYEDGYIIFADGGYVLFTNTEYDAGTTFDTEVVDGGVPGLPVCFTAGTMIETAQGPVAIEDLKVGDLVLGSTGYRTVKWVGWRYYLLRSPRFTEAYRKNIVPVRIKAHALADNVPSRDIVLSPWHHLYIDNVLVKANQLVNGVSVLRETEVSRVTYYHVELDQFDVVCAHNLYSESWADGGNRDFFENVDVATLRPEDQMRRRADRPGFTVLNAKDPLMTAIRARLAARAEQFSLKADLSAAA